MNDMSQTRVIQQAIAYWRSTTARSNSTASWWYGEPNINGGHRVQMGGPGTTGAPASDGPVLNIFFTI